MCQSSFPQNANCLEQVTAPPSLRVIVHREDEHGSKL